MIFKIAKKVLIESVQLSPDLTQDDFNNGIFDVTNDHSKLLEMQGNINRNFSDKINSHSWDINFLNNAQRETSNDIDSLKRSYGNMDYNQTIFQDKQESKNRIFNDTLNKTMIAVPIASGVIGAAAGYGASVLTRNNLNKGRR